MGLSYISPPLHGSLIVCVQIKLLSTRSHGAFIYKVPGVVRLYHTIAQTCAGTSKERLCH
jgi:hypothetical protein